MWKKVVLAAVFIFLGQDVPGCAIFVFPGNPLSIPQKYLKVVFDGFCMFLAKCCKKIGKSGRPKVLNLLLRPMWKRLFWGATLHFFGIDVPRCAILVFRGSPPQVVQKKIWPPKNVSSIAGSYVKQSVLRLCCSFFSHWKGREKATTQTWSMYLRLFCEKGSF